MDFSYLSPPPAVHAISHRSTHPTTQSNTSMRLLTINEFAEYSMMYFLPQKRSKPSNYSKSISDNLKSAISSMTHSFSNSVTQETLIL